MLSLLIELWSWSFLIGALWGLVLVFLFWKLAPRKRCLYCKAPVSIEPFHSVCRSLWEMMGYGGQEPAKGVSFGRLLHKFYWRNRDNLEKYPQDQVAALLEFIALFGGDTFSPEELKPEQYGF